MQPLDLQVVEQAQGWLSENKTIWLVTVLSTFGSSPRGPGSLLVAAINETPVGSLSGGCVEEDFIHRLNQHEFINDCQRLQYGSADNERQGVSLPCNGVLDILIERIQPSPDNYEHVSQLAQALTGQTSLLRSVHLINGEKQLTPAEPVGPIVTFDSERVGIRVGPIARLVIAGLSPVSEVCAQFAYALGFDVVLCDPRSSASELSIEGVTVHTCMPSDYIAQAGNCHSATAVVALTHDPRIDDLALMEAVRTEAFYIGAMGSKATSKARAERLARSGGLSEAQINTIHMPIGLALGSKTPAEIALAVMADVVRVMRGRPREQL